MFKNIYPVANYIEGAQFNEEFIKKCLSIQPRYLQVRMKESPADEMIKTVEKVICIRNELKSNTKIIVNDSIKVALTSKADGVHLGQEDDCAEGLKKDMPDFIVGLSTHTLVQIETANRMNIDYIGFGPVFKTGTKKTDNKAVFEIVHSAVDLSIHPIVFIGGINKRNIEYLPVGGKILYAMISGLDELFFED